MASGTPALTSFAGAWPEVISSGTDSTLVNIENQKGINDTLRALLADIDVLEKMGKSGFNKILASYTVEKEANALCDFFKQVQNEK